MQLSNLPTSLNPDTMEVLRIGDLIENKVTSTWDHSVARDQNIEIQIEENKYQVEKNDLINIEWAIQNTK